MIIRTNCISAVFSWQGNLNMPSTRSVGGNRQPLAWQRQGALFGCPLTMQDLSSLGMRAQGLLWCAEPPGDVL